LFDILTLLHQFPSSPGLVTSLLLTAFFLKFLTKSDANHQESLKNTQDTIRNLTNDFGSQLKRLDDSSREQIERLTKSSQNALDRIFSQVENMSKNNISSLTEITKRVTSLEVSVREQIITANKK
jgi:hypothetical protein